VDIRGLCHKGVHGDAADFAHFSHGQTVREGLWVLPDIPEILHRSHLCTKLDATIGVDTHDIGAGSNVGEQMSVLKNGHHGLIIEKDPHVRDHVPAALVEAMSFNIEESKFTQVRLFAIRQGRLCTHLDHGDTVLYRTGAGIMSEALAIVTLSQSVRCTMSQARVPSVG
jgi:hypothetical protein